MCLHICHLYTNVCVYTHVCRCHMCKHILKYMMYPPTEEIRLQIFGSPDPDLSVFLIDLLSDGDSVFSREFLFEIVGIPVKT